MTQITNEQVSQLLKINPEGDPYNIRFSLENIIGSFDFKNTEITFNYILNKFTDYNNWWKSKYGDKDEQYISKQNKLQNLEQFLGQRLYLQDYSIEYKTDFRYSYIFGDINTIKAKYNYIYGNKTD